MKGKTFTQHFFALLASCCIAGTASAQTYCTPSAGSAPCDNGYIDEFSTFDGATNISNVSSCSSGFVSGNTHTAELGSMVNFHVNATATGTIGIWVDWNGDFDFDDVDEQMFSYSSPYSGNVSSSFTVPATAVVGTTRMRVRYSSEMLYGGDFLACNYVETGEYEDYNFVVTIPPNTYCLPHTDYGCDYSVCINNFSTSGGSTNIANNSSSCNPGYVYGQAHTGLQGSNVSFSITTGIFSMYTKIWVDWNQDYDFDDAGEEVYYSNGKVTTASGAFIIPEYAQSGTTRMRVRSTYSLADGFTACDFQEYTEYEDYDFVVTSTSPPCTGSPAAGTVSASGAISFCGISNVRLSLAGYSTGNGITYQWQSSVDTGANWTDIPGATAVLYNANSQTASTDLRAAVTCTASSMTGYSNIVSITVNEYYTPTVSITPPVQFCHLQPAVLTATGSDAGTAPVYTWYRDNVAVPGETSAVYISNTYSKNTPEQVYMTVSNIDNACARATTATSATIDVQPIAALDPNTTYTTASASTKLCEGDAVTFTSKSASAPGATFSWAKDSVIIPGVTGSTYTTAQAGVITATVTSAEGCTRSASRIINPLPTAVVTAQEPTVFCPGDSVILAATPVDGASYRWKQDAISRGVALTQVAKTAGAYTVTVTKNSCAATSAPIVVSPRVTNTIVTATTPTTVCAPATVTLQATPDAGYAYQWYRSSAPISGATSSSFSTSISGSYKVELSNNGCTPKISLSTTATINTAPSAVITKTVNGYAYNTLRATGTGTGVSYQWYKSDTAISGATARDYTASASGSYRVMSTKNGCSEYSTAPYIVMLGNGAKFTTVANEAAIVSIFPNPSAGLFNIGSEQPVNVIVKDVQGRIVADLKNTSSVDLSAQSVGMYIMSISDTDGKLLQVERVVKQ